jgi:hypothetical protein
MKNKYFEDLAKIIDTIDQTKRDDYREGLKTGLEIAKKLYKAHERE